MKGKYDGSKDAGADLRERRSTKRPKSGLLKKRTLGRYGRATSELRRAGVGVLFDDGVVVSSPSRFYDVRDVLGEVVRAAADPRCAPGKVTTLKDMSPEKREEMLRLYGGKE